MPSTKSRDGRFIISAPDSAKTASKVRTNGEDEKRNLDIETDVYLKAVEGKDVNLIYIANAIWFDCFDCDSVGLHLLAERLKCHVTVGERKYEFTVGNHNHVDSCLKEIAYQLKL